MVKEIPPDKLDGAVLFFNGKTSQMEILLPKKGEFRNLTEQLLESTKPFTDWTRTPWTKTMCPTRTSMMKGSTRVKKSFFLFCYGYSIFLQVFEYHLVDRSGANKTSNFTNTLIYKVFNGLVRRFL